MELSELPVYVYPIVFILLVIIVAVVSLLIGKRKYNQEHGIVKEKKVKAPKVKKENTGKKLKRAESASTPSSFKDEFDTDDEYDNAVESLKTAPAAKPKQRVVEGPVIVVDEKKVNEEEIIEWKPPTEDKKVISEQKSAVNETDNSASAATASTATASTATASSAAAAASTAATAAPVAAAAPLAEPSESNWDDEDLELFEARSYSFDEETQSGIVTDKSAAAAVAAKEEKPAEVPPETMYAFREKKEPSRNPEDDEGVQIFETKDEKPEPAPKIVPKEEPKVSNSKYAYFDAVMEKEKMETKKETEWQPPEQRTAPATPPASAASDSAASAASASTSATPKPKKSMQYIELDLDDKE
ncbi:hypothetical protein LJC08_01490 [Methanimicrococcus sp. OttesenSCG-928-J09]|nr:hypothetical protein [Methanimicrococcus sp. OttesenSCG-928-J09]